jgi:hypothetical protein
MFDDNTHDSKYLRKYNLHEIKEVEKQWKDYFNNLPELKCNYCGVIFKGEHECDHEKLKQKVERYEIAMKRIQNNYQVKDVDYIPITELYEIQLIIKNALEEK